MKRREFLLSGAACGCLGRDASAAAAGQSFARVSGGLNYILDTDMGDCDDIGDVGASCAFHRLGGTNLIGVICTSAATRAPSAIKALVNFSIPTKTIPIGQYNGAVSLVNADALAMGATTIAFGITVNDNLTNYPGHVQTYRTLLADSPDASVVISMTGGCSSLSEALMSSADSISPLTGIQLIAAKVVACVWETTNLPGSSASFNTLQDITGAQTLMANWPSTVPFMFASDVVGGPTFTTPVQITADVSPSVMAYNICGNAAGSGKQAWGQVADYWAAYAVPNVAPPSWLTAPASLWNIGGSNGTVTIGNDGSSTWSATAGFASYLAINGSVAQATINAQLNNILAIGSGNPGGGNPAVAPTADFSAVPNCIAWYQPSNPAAVITNSGTVTGLTDLSGSGNDANVPTAYGTGPVPTAPTVTTNVVNGLQALTFDGVANQIGIDAVAGLLSGSAVPFHVFMVVSLTSTTGLQVLFDLTKTGNAQTFLNRVTLQINGTSYQAYRVGSSNTNNTASGGSFTANRFTLLELVYDPTATTVWQNLGILSDTGNCFESGNGGNAQAAASLTLAIGRLFAQFNDNGSGASPAAGYLVDTAVISGRILSGGERMKRVLYLNTRYSLGIKFL